MPPKHNKITDAKQTCLRPAHRLVSFISPRLYQKSVEDSSVVFFFFFNFLELVRQLLSPSGPLLKQSWHLSNGKKILLTTHLQTGLHSQGPFLVLYGWLRSAAFPCRNLSTSATSRRRSCPGLHPVWLWPLARFAPSYYAAVWIYSI